MNTISKNLVLDISVLELENEEFKQIMRDNLDVVKDACLHFYKKNARSLKNYEIAKLYLNKASNKYTNRDIGKKFKVNSTQIRPIYFDVYLKTRRYISFLWKENKIQATRDEKERLSNDTLYNLRHFFSVRTYNSLCRGGIQTFAELKTKSDEDLLLIRNFGEACLEEVHEIIKVLT